MRIATALLVASGFWPVSDHEAKNSDELPTKTQQIMRNPFSACTLAADAPARTWFLHILMLISLCLTTAVARANSIELQSTGQTKCYSASGAEIECANTWQDGEMQSGRPWPSPRFTDNGNQTLTDNLTGLIWPKNASSPGPSACLGWMNWTWQYALDFAACLNSNLYLGFSDWRLPNANELGSLVNSGQANVYSWLNTQGFTGVQGKGYWSSTTSAGDTNYGWYLDFYKGGISQTTKSSLYTALVLPVRGATPASSGNSATPKTGQSVKYSAGDDGDLQIGVSWPAPRFTDNGDQTVTDNLSGLMWTKSADAPGPTECAPGGTRIWQATLDYAKCLNLNN